MSTFTLPNIPGEFVSENEFFLKNATSGDYLFYNGVGHEQKKFSDPYALCYMWNITDTSITSLDGKYSIPLSVSVPPVPVPEPVPVVETPAPIPEPVPVVETPAPVPEPVPVVEEQSAPEASS